jgi:hypothetical protein
VGPASAGDSATVLFCFKVTVTVTLVGLPSLPAALDGLLLAPDGVLTVLAPDGVLTVALDGLLTGLLSMVAIFDGLLAVPAVDEEAGC